VDATVINDMMQNPEFRDGVIYSVIKVRGLKIDGCVMIQYGLMSKLHEVSLGGDGDIAETQPQVRQLSPATRIYSDRLLNELVSDLASLWPGAKSTEFSHLEPTINQPNWGPQGRSADVFTATIDVGPLASPYGLMSIALPVRLFETALGVRALKKAVTEESPLENAPYVQGLPVQMIAELQRFKLSLNQIDDLSVGDFIPLHEKMEVAVRVNSIMRFIGEFGENGGFRAVKIDERISGED
jgi:flagellar motor switch protein FliM